MIQMLCQEDNVLDNSGKKHFAFKSVPQQLQINTFKL